MRLSSLSVFRGIMKRTVPRAYYKLLCSADAPVHEFLAAWGSFAGLLAERGFTASLAGCMTEAALFDDNAFSRAAAAGKADKLHPDVKNAAIRDIRAIITAASLTPEQLISGYRDPGAIRDIADSLPLWETGSPVPELADEVNIFGRLAAYYRRSGCGMYARYRAFIWRNKNVEPVPYPDRTEISSLCGYDLQRGIVIDNTTAFLSGKLSNNCLLYGDRGTGKSSTVKAILNKYYTEGLRMVEMPKDRLSEFPLLVEQIASVPMKFIIFIDDLSFSGEDKSYAQLKAVLEGGLAARPDNTLIYATSNRRHLIKENFSDRDGEDMHRNDTMQETLSLSDRFGLSVNFSKPGKDEYLAIVASLADEYGIDVDRDKLFSDAEQWALARGGRSPRCARQFIASVGV